MRKHTEISMVGLIGKTAIYKQKNKNFLVDEYLDTNHVIDTFNDYFHIFDFDKKLYNFHDPIRRHINNLLGCNIEELSKCHEVLPKDFLFVDEHNINPLTESFYNITDTFIQTYEEFMKFLISQFFNFDYYYQHTPTIRAQLAGAIETDDRPRVHNDIMLGHPPAEINIWVPFTEVYGENSLLLAPLDQSIEIIKSLDFDFELFTKKAQHDDGFFKELKSILKPLALGYGQAIIFDSRCLHATQRNTTNNSRLSMDMRIIGKKDLDDSPINYVGTGRLKMPFQPGLYYHNDYVSQGYVGN